MPAEKLAGLRERLQAELEALRERAQLRALEIPAGVDLGSNDYLGLARDPRLKQALLAAVAAAERVGSTGSRLLSGNSPDWEMAEAEFARFAGAETALYFGSGYAANLGLLGAVLRPGDIVFSDAANHASLIDGMRLAGARKVIYPHCDLDALEHELRRLAGDPAQKFIVTESLFSMEGDRAPLADLLALARRFGADVIADEAHAVGVLGPGGRGLVAELGAQSEVLAVVHTCGKALASAGAFVCSSSALREYLVNRARTFIFSTAQPPYLAHQVVAAMRLAQEMGEERAYLADLAARLRRGLRDAGFDTGASDSQIVPVILGEERAALACAEALQRSGFAVRAIRPPTVPADTSRLRLSLTTRITQTDVDRVVSVLAASRQDLPGADA
jgi:8-amino-7-oxononanoate synthase